MINFDNAATSGVKPDCVINAVIHTLRKLSVNSGRSSHKLSLEALSLITDTREAAAEFFGLDNIENVIFTKNCTEALNLAILGTVKEGGEIIISANEHNSVIRPCYELEKQGRVRVKVVPPDVDGCITAEAVDNLINERTYLVCVNHVSNVTGGTSDIEEISALCREKNILFLSDLAQSAGHIDVDMGKSGISLCACAGHKGLLSPQGLGLLLIKSGVKVKPVMFGGTGTESYNVYQPSEYPEALESGTLNLPAIAGLNAALRFLGDNKERMHMSLEENFKLLYKSLKGNPMVKLYSHPNKCGIISFLVNGYDSSMIGEILDKNYNIAVRTGLHCAPLIHTHMGTLKSGLVRVSLSPYNTLSEVRMFIDAIDHITYN